MASVADLMGVGFAAAQAGKIATTPSAVTATGTSAGTAANITTRMTLVASATSQTGAILPSSAAPGEAFFISCATGSTASAVIYPPSGATITNASSITLAADKNMIVWRYSTTLWFHIILA